MPNWTANRIRVGGDEPDLRAFLEAVKWQDQIFDFNRIIPMPEILKHTASGNSTIAGKNVTSWYVINDSNPLSGEDNVRLFTRQEKALLKHIGHNDWYSWCNANWGTKWNACDAHIEEDDGCLAITFNTAWCEPEPIFRKLGQLFPKLSFHCEWRYEDDDFYPHSLFIEAEAA